MMNVVKRSLMGIILGSLVVVLLSSCGGEKPKKVAEEAINAEITAALSENGDFERFYSFLSTSDRDACTLDNFKDFYRLPIELTGALELIPEAKQHIKVSDFKETITGERAVVTFKITLPDTDAMGKLSLSDLQSLAGMKWQKLTDLPEEIQNKIVADVAANGIPEKEMVQQVNMVREEDSWKLQLGLKQQIADNRRIRTVFHENR